MTSATDGVRDVLAERDPVAAFWHADRAGELVALRTAGTSGAARTLLRSTRSWVTSFPQVTALAGIDEDAVVWVPGPLTASMNLFAAVHATAVGARLVGPGDPVTAASALRAATHAHLTPALLHRLVADEEARSALSGTRLVVAGDGLGRAACERARSAGASVSHYYGAAELSFVAWGSHDGDLRPFPDVEVAERGGELWVRSPYLCRGYAGPGTGPLRRSTDGFATVGDRGRYEDGFVRVEGRGAEAVTTAGATVLVADVSAALRDLVTGELVVLGLPHPDLGNILAAVLTHPEDLDALRTAARDRLPPSHRPRRWYAMSPLPTTGAGKVDAAAVRSSLLRHDGPARPLT
jgi:long-chain acyl-CoA synthetase